MTINEPQNKNSQACLQRQLGCKFIFDPILMVLPRVLEAFIYFLMLKQQILIAALVWNC
jgi:hypothetical protein